VEERVLAGLRIWRYDLLASFVGTMQSVSIKKIFEERNRHVQMLGFIYKSAGSVLIWVDDKAPDGVDESTRWEAIDPALEAMTILSSVERFLLRPSYNTGRAAMRINLIMTFL
jgi:hypothetical protein